MANALVIGLLGGIASGKSTVASQLARLGARVLDADRIAHAVLRDPTVKQRIRRRWGHDVFTRSGAIDRRSLAARAFASPDDHKALVRITHPLILKRIRRQLALAKQTRHSSPVVLDAALLAESGLAKLCDLLVFVSCDRQRRQQQAAARHRWSTSELARRERFQMPLSQKRRMAHIVLTNHGSLDDLRRQVLRLFAAIQHAPPATASGAPNSRGSRPSQHAPRCKNRSNRKGKTNSPPPYADAHPQRRHRAQKIYSSSVFSVQTEVTIHGT